eukprot:CFRG3924T1
MVGKLGALAIIVSITFTTLLAVYYIFPDVEMDQRNKLVLPRNLEQARDLGNVLKKLQQDNFVEIAISFFLVYILLQTFAIPGSIFMTILSGALFPFPMALFLVCMSAAIGATGCYCLSRLFGKALVLSYFPERINSWQLQVNQHASHMVNYIIFLRVTPILPNWFINITAPVIHVPVRPFFIGTFIGVAPPSVFFIQAGQGRFFLYCEYHNTTVVLNGISGCSGTVLGACACLGAMITSLLMTPFDVVKVRMQTQAMKPGQPCNIVFSNGLMDHVCTVCNQPPSKHGRVFYRSTVDAFLQIPRAEGLSSLWRGLAPTLVMAVPATVIYFTAYDQLKCRIQGYANRKIAAQSLPDNSSNLTSALFQNAENTSRSCLQIGPLLLTLSPLIAGMTARLGASTIISPLELMRTSSQAINISGSVVSRRTVFAEVRKMVKVHGLRSLWRGLGSTLWRDLPFSAIYWTSYEKIKSHPNLLASTQTGDLLHSSTLDNFRVSFISGALAGTFAAVLTTPFDVIKTHQQVDLQSLKQRPGLMMARDIYARGGISGLFAGLVPRIVKVAPACAIMIGTYEGGKMYFMRKRSLSS